MAVWIPNSYDERSTDWIKCFLLSGTLQNCTAGIKSVSNYHGSIINSSVSSPKQETSEVDIGWCDKDGCGAGQGYTLTQSIPAMINENVQYAEVCADLKLENDILKYTQIDCNEAVMRKPLCMKGEPMVQEEARFSKLRHMKSHRNKLLCRKQKLLKARLKLLNKKLRRESSLSRKVRQADAPPVDMCITGG